MFRVQIDDDLTEEREPLTKQLNDKIKSEAKDPIDVDQIEFNIEGKVTSVVDQILNHIVYADSGQDK